MEIMLNCDGRGDDDHDVACEQTLIHAVRRYKFVNAPASLI